MAAALTLAKVKWEIPTSVFFLRMRKRETKA